MSWWPPRLPEIPRWVRVVGTVAGTWGGLRYYDRYRTGLILDPIKAEAQLIADQPMGLDEMPRRLLVVYNSRAKGQVFFKEFVKPVLDAAALDYKTFDTARGAAYDVAHELKDAGGNVDGIIALSTSIFREVVKGMQDRVTEQGEAAAVPIGFIPTPHQYGLAKLVGIFDDASKTYMMGKPTMDIANGATRPMTLADLDYAEGYADVRDERRQKLTDGSVIIYADRERVDGLQLFTPSINVEPPVLKSEENKD